MNINSFGQRAVASTLILAIGFLAGMLSCEARADESRSSLLPSVVGVHIATYHDQHGFNNFNPGVYAKWESGVVAGTYYNSERHQSYYAGYTWETGALVGPVHAALTLGAVTGYRSAKVAPMVLPSIYVPFGTEASTSFRVTYVPRSSPRGPQAVHFSVDYRF